MIKRVVAAILCLIMAVSVFASCAQKKDANDKGAIINMYLSQEIYDFDPAYAYKNDAALKVVDLIFSSLFRIGENGKLENELADSYVIDKIHNTLTITIDEKATWSDGTYISANDVVFAFKRVLDPEFSSEVACLLFDIKNARTVKNATSDYYVDDIGIYPVGEREVEITFEDGFTDYEGFLYNLASPALAPLREDLVTINEGDWAKKPGTMACSGPFKLSRISYDPADKGFTLERNAYYFRESDEAVDKSVLPYRIVVDYTKTAEEQYEMFQKGQLFYVGDIALSIRGTVDAEITDALSTASIYLNEDKCVGPVARKLDKEEKGKTEEYEERGIKYVKTTHSTYYTYYNYMTDEEYAAKYGDVPYTDPSAQAFKSSNYRKYTSYTDVKIEETNGEKIVYLDEYQELRFAVTTQVGEESVDVLTVDAPGGVKLFADANVRKALSLAINREDIAKKVVYAKAATAFVPSGIFGTDYNRKTDFREDGGVLINNTKGDVTAAKQLLSGINAANFEIELAVKSNDEVHVLIAEEIAAAWTELGFKVCVNKVSTMANDEKGSTGEVSTDIRDDEFLEMYENATYSAILVDVVAPTPSAYAFLAPFANDFAGTAVDMDPYAADTTHLYEVMGHRSGYNNPEYDKKIEAALKATTAEEKAAALHEAEKLLIEDAAVIPVIFNQDAYVISKELTKVESTYFNTRIFTGAKLKDYQLYFPTEN